MPSRFPRRRFFLTVLRLILISVCLFASSRATWARSDEPHWLLVSSRHFSVLTDAGEPKGREVALRLEQMRAVFAQLLQKNRLNLSEPLDVIALKSDDEYARLAPVQNGQLTSAGGFFLPGADRNYIVLDMAIPDSWRSVLHDVAGMLLNFNYPPTQPWFDEGFAEYFSSLRVDARQAQLGADPGGSQPLTQVLQNSPWLPIPDLFNASTPVGAGRDTMFHAESWMVLHYLIDKNQLSETGTYFDLVENQKVAVDKAIESAYSASAAQLQQSVKLYFTAISGQLASGIAPFGDKNAAIQQFPPPVDAGQMGASSQDITPARAQALLAEAAVRLPAHRDAGIADLRSLAGDEKTDTAIVHRALAWVDIQKNDLPTATEQLNKALEIDGNDSWSRYYLSAVRYRAAEGSGQYFQGMANMLQDLRAVLDWNPDFADAYNMLAMARVQGGGSNSAIEAMRAAILLSPRNLTYQLNMAQIYMAAKKWEAATALLNQLKASKDPQIAADAQKQLTGLPTLRKYGIMPLETAQPSIGTTSPPSQSPASSPKPQTEESGEQANQTPPEPQPDTRKVEFVKGKLVRIDCSGAPAAVITMSVAGKTMKLRTENYKTLLLIGVDKFSCGWTNLPVSANYKAGGKTDGDLVSLEIQ